MSNLDNLWELQEIRKKYLALKRKEQAVLNSQEVKSLEAMLSASKGKQDLINSKIGGMEKDIKKKEIDCQALQDRKAALHEELYSGKSNAKELSGIQKRLEKTEADLSAAEDDIIRLSQEAELMKESIGSIHQEVSELDNRLGILKANLEVELQGIRHEMAEVKEAHGTVLKSIDKRILRLYDKKFKQFSVTAVAKVSGGLCTGCNVHLSRYIIAEVKKGEGLVGCENCGRILYYAGQPELSK